MTEFAKSIENIELFYMKHLKKTKQNRWIQESSGNWKLASENKHHNTNELTEEKYIEDEKSNGYQINELTYEKLNLQEFIETIKSYCLPTIEFGILPTKQLLDKIIKLL